VGVGGGGQSKGGGDEGVNDAKGGRSKETSVVLLEYISGSAYS